MIFSTEQIQELLDIVERNVVRYSAKVLGVEVLSKRDKSFLEENLEKTISSFDEAYLFGKLSSLLKESQTKSLTYSDFKKYIERGQYIPLSPLENNMLEIAKRKTYTHIKGLGDDIKKDISQIINNKESLSRQEYEKIIKDEISEGIFKRKALTEIVSDIGHKTKDWERNLGRIVETEWNNIFQDGRAQQIREKQGDDTLVYKNVYPGACRHCIKAYTTQGIGSKPRLFKLADLELNGSNVGRKVKEWKPVLDSMHPFCRCTLQYIPRGFQWSEEKKDFIPKFTSKYSKDKVGVIKVMVGDKVFEV